MRRRFVVRDWREGPQRGHCRAGVDAGSQPVHRGGGTDTPGLLPPAAAASSSGGPATYNADLPGLYGGTRNYTTCDAGKLVNFLEQNPSKAAAWASTLSIKASQIRDYVSRLTDVILRTDTRVTCSSPTCPAVSVLALKVIDSSMVSVSPDVDREGLAKAEPKRLRYRLLHVAGRLAFSGRRCKLHLQDTWPWAAELVAAFAKLKTIAAATG